MKFTKGNIALRAGLGFVFLYAGVNSILDPQQWVGFVPQWVETFGFTREFALQAHAAGEIGLALLILSGLKRRWAAAAAFVLLTGIVVISGVGLLPTTFRDIGLALAALAYGFSEAGESNKGI
jgi:uncharacterized membrane protein YphA (DoxX/SURF4 family)